MKLHFEEDLVEAAVHLCVAGRCKKVSSMLIARFNRERENLYAILDPDERNAAFFTLHLEWFREWGLDQLLTAPLLEFPLLPGRLNVVAFRKSRRKHDDGTELYVNQAGERTGLVAIAPERLARGPELAAFLRHELTHLQDMIDPAFEYVAELKVPSPSLSQRRLAMERYRVLWDVSIDGRLTRAARPTIASKDQRWRELDGVFSFWSPARRHEVFERLWTQSSPTHGMLEALVCDERQLQTGEGPRPGSPCPLCGFPTFAWAAASRLTGELTRAIQVEFPLWNDEQGVCKRCFDVYRAMACQVPLVV